MKISEYLYRYKAFVSAAYDGDTVTADIDLGLEAVEPDQCAGGTRRGARVFGIRLQVFVLRRRASQLTFFQKDHLWSMA